MDRRIGKTRKSLVSALHTLMLIQAWDDINVQMICNEADIARSTFYAHFTTKHDLLDFAFARLSQELSIPSEGRGLDYNYSFHFLPPLLDHLKSHREIMKRNETSGSGRVIFNKFRQVASEVAKAEIMASNLRSHLSKDEVTFLFGGLFAMIEDWNNTHCLASITDVLGRLDQRVKMSIDSGS